MRLTRPVPSLPQYRCCRMAASLHTIADKIVLNRKITIDLTKETPGKHSVRATLSFSLHLVPSAMVLPILSIAACTLHASPRRKQQDILQLEHLSY